MSRGLGTATRGTEGPGGDQAFKTFHVLPK